MGSRHQGMPIDVNGMLIMRAQNNDPQHDEPSRSVIAVDAADGTVRWEIPDVYGRFGSCEPAVDSQGRVWVTQREGSALHGSYAGVAAFDLADGTKMDGTFIERDGVCGGTAMHIAGEGAHERLIMYGNRGTAENFFAVDLSGEDPEIAREFDDADDAGFEMITGAPRTGTGGDSRFHPRVDVATSDSGGSGTISGYDLATGAVQWESEVGTSPEGNVSPTDADGAIYSQRRGDGTTSHWLNSLSPQGEERWTIRAGSIRAAVVAADGDVDDPDDVTLGISGNVAVGVLGRDGTIFAANRQQNWFVALDNSGGLGDLPEVDDDDPEVGDPGVARVAGDATSGGVAIEICDFLTEDGPVERIALARDDDFADALAGSALPGLGCILFTSGGPTAPLDDDVADQIDDALVPGGTVFVLGGDLAVSSNATDELTAEGYDVQRLHGPTRYETAEEIAIAVGVLRVDEPDPATVAEEVDEVILASGGDWPDAITSGGYAAATATPILLTPPPDEFPELHPAAARAIDALQPDRTHVGGGEAVVGLTATDAVPAPQRVAGPNRMATAVAVADQLWTTVPTFAGDRFITANLEHPDGWVLALAAAPLSAEWSAPQLGLRADDYPSETDAYLSGQAFTDLPSVALLGDVGFISDEVADQVHGTVQP